MGIAKDLFDIVIKITEFVKNGYIENAEDKKNFFNNHIDPAFLNMEKIQVNYLKNFTTLLKIRNKEEYTTENIIDWLKDRKIDFQTNRDRISKIETEVFKNMYFSKSFKKQTEISEWTLKFLNDITNYFSDGIFLDKMTWYSYLIQGFEASLFNQKREPGKPAGVPFFIENKKDVFSKIENTIDIIKSRYDFIGESYSNLRGLCL